MSHPNETRSADDYELVPATSVAHDRLAAFVAMIWPEQAVEERIRAFWWKRAGPTFAVAAVHRPSGAMAGLCGGRHCEWTIAERPLPAVAICDWYVSPQHAGKGIGKRLVQHFDAPERFLYAFSISDAAIANFQKLGWAGPYRSSVGLLLIPPLIARHLAFLSAPNGLALQDYALAGGQPLGALGAALDHIETLRSRDAPPHMRRDAADWSWRLSVCGERRYRFCVASRDGQPVGYVVVRQMTPGRSRRLDRLGAAIITDLVAANDDPAILRTLAARAVAIAAELHALVVVTATTTPAHQRALARMGFVSPALPLAGRFLLERSPQFMWLPRGAASALRADAMALSFADVAIDLDL
jgi:GNAT superfamily N-acetyltransferase